MSLKMKIKKCYYKTLYYKNISIELIALYLQEICQFRFSIIALFCQKYKSFFNGDYFSEIKFLSL